MCLRTQDMCKLPNFNYTYTSVYKLLFFLQATIELLAYLTATVKLARKIHMDTYGKTIFFFNSEINLPGV